MKNEKRSELAEAIIACKSAFYASAVFSFFINLLLFTSPLYMLQVYDRVLSSRNTTTLLMLTLIVALMMAIQGLLEFARSRVLVRAGVRLDGMMGPRIFRTLFKMNVGQSSPQALQDLSTLREFLTGPGFITFCDMPWAPIFIGVGFMFHPLLGWMCLGSAIVLFILALVNDSATKGTLQHATREQMSSSNFVQTSMRNAEVVVAMGMMPAIMGRWQKRHRRYLALQALASDKGGLLIAISKFLRMFLQSAVLGLGAYLAIKGEISSGVIIATSIVLGRALGPIDSAVGYWKGFVAARGSWGRLTELLKAIPPDIEHMRLPEPKGALVVEAVVASAPNSALPILKGVSFALTPGTTLGIIGPSGTGKSTLARIMVGVWPLRSGVVRLDGADINSWRREDLGRFMGYLPQDVELFDGTVAENIARLGVVDSGAVVDASMTAGVHEMILGLPHGYDTPIGAGGNVLSGGQRQRIALARALYGNPPFIVMDEPNSNLDAAGEEALLRAVETTKKRGATIIIITHRMSILNAVDALVVMRDGIVDVSGPREAVLKHLNDRSAPAVPRIESPVG